MSCNQGCSLQWHHKHPCLFDASPSLLPLLPLFPLSLYFCLTRRPHLLQAANVETSCMVHPMPQIQKVGGGAHATTSHSVSLPQSAPSFCSLNHHHVKFRVCVSGSDFGPTRPPCHTSALLMALMWLGSPCSQHCRCTSGSAVPTSRKSAAPRQPSWQRTCPMEPTCE